MPIELFINSSSDIDNLISQYSPDIVKVNIEGYELNLLKCKNILKVKEWLVECHSREICEQVESLFLQEGFNVTIIDYRRVIKSSLPINVLIAVNPFLNTNVVAIEP